MPGGFTTVFGMRVVVATPKGWETAVAKAKEMGAIEVNDAAEQRTEYHIVIDERAGVILVNPKREHEVMAALTEHTAAAMKPPRDR